MVEYRPTLWIMGGLDPLGASGVSLDLRMVAQRPVHSCVFVTRLTVQTFTTFEEGLQADNSLFLAQCLSLKYATPPQALKLGMLGSEAQWEQLLEALSGLECPLVFDPIISTSSGNKILNNSHLSKVIRDLLPKVSLITPNLWEAELLVGFKIATDNDFVEAAKKLGSYGVSNVLIKGGHGESAGDKGEIRGFYWDGKQGAWLMTERQRHSCRGTGCALSTLIAAELCQGTSMIDSLVIGQRHLDLAYRRAYHTRNLPRSLPRLLPTAGGDEFCLAPRMIPYQNSQMEKVEFPKIGGDLGTEDATLGFYPIVPSFQWVRRLGEWGVKTIQLRVKHMEPTLLEQIIEQSVAYAQTIGLRLFINDYWFLAQKYQAYGVHLGQEDLDAMDYSQLLKLSHSGIRLGISTHSESELAKALGLGPSYVALGPIFSTTCKSMAFGPHGLAKISQWRQMTDLPIVAIGGMKPGHIKEAFQRGASGIAVISDVLEHPDPEKRCREWSRQVDSNRRFLF